MNGGLPDQGRLEVAVRIDSGHVAIEKWRDENEDGTWVWIESGFVDGRGRPGAAPAGPALSGRARTSSALLGSRGGTLMVRAW